MDSIPVSLKGTLETVLVVDDDDLVLNIVVAVLKHANYRVFFAHNGAEAVKLADGIDGNIHLLLSDVDMPQMSGLELGKALKTTRPDLRVMLMSGGDHGLLILTYGWSFLQKPFLAAKLVEMVADVLRSPDRSQPGEGFDTRQDSRPR